MSAFAALGRILYLLALLGIVTSPLSVGTAAGAMVHSSHMMMDDASGMANHSPCFPEEQTKPKEGCGTACTLPLVVCSASVPACVNQESGWRVDRSACELSHQVADDSDLSSALVEPPSPPPRA